MTNSLSITLFFIISAIVQWVSAQSSCASNLNDRKISFYATSTRNDSGHLLTKFIADNLAVRKSKRFAVDVSSEWICKGQRQGIRIEGVLIAAPSPPEGYKLYSGIGFYKYHEKPLEFDDAKKMCEDEGGHLAVPDSKEEGEVLVTLVKKEQTYIGAHDRVTEGKFMTIFGAPIGNHIAWNPNQPDNSGGNEHCVTIVPTGKLNDVPCSHNAPFICEFDLTWSD